MSVPKYDLNKVQFSSEANAFKNDGTIYTGTLNFPTSIAGNTTVTVSQTVALTSAPQFSLLFAYFQDYMDTLQQYFYGSGYSGQAWYPGTVDNKVGLVATAPAPQAGPVVALIYPVINGNTVTVTGIVPNPYSVTITLTALSVPWSFIEYTMTN